MKSVAALSLLVASAAAFAPQQTSRASTSLAAFENELGAQPPLGFWDPLNMLDGVDQARFDRLRYVEIKHGRIAMLAVLGHIHTTFGARIPGNIDFSGKSFASIKTGIAGLKDIPTAGLLQIVAFVGFLELFVMKDKGNGEFPGDLRNGMFTWSGSDEELKQKRAIELNNGRAAQMGILGLMVHEMLDGEPYVINALFGNPSNFNAGL
ncbi:fucoxanthin chlorophyll a/c binding protein [Nitzschia inconspicua]|uniref:Fucoxanthin chlorophyll a/c binding protein n=1 Tax=Nitzschia inconspicua TaxID=303405 RepID=A0A9K3L2G0_9STRA|nr:fucoxanthin chlorophyll a/c binding protein [Nitzschia inconspicua]KAG7354287.1 fucoxanthin chlorophyll a/c binding protein [Nitzschia inconspicua]